MGTSVQEQGRRKEASESRQLRRVQPSRNVSLSPEPWVRSRASTRGEGTRTPSQDLHGLLAPSQELVEPCGTGGPGRLGVKLSMYSGWPQRCVPCDLHAVGLPWPQMGTTCLAVCILTSSGVCRACPGTPRGDGLSAPCHLLFPLRSCDLKRLGSLRLKSIQFGSL